MSETDWGPDVGKEILPPYCEPMHPGEDGWSEWIHPLPGYLMQCCDCGLIHEMEFAIGRRKDKGPLNEGESDLIGVILFRARRYASAIEAGTGETA